MIILCFLQMLQSSSFDNSFVNDVIKKYFMMQYYEILAISKKKYIHLYTI